MFSGKRLRKIAFGIALVAVVGATTYGILSQFAVGKPPNNAKGERRHVVVATLTKATLDGVNESFPAIYHFKLRLTVETPISGSLKKGTVVLAHYAKRSKVQPKLPIGEKVLVQLERIGKRFDAGSLELANPKKIKAAQKVAKANRDRLEAIRKDPKKHPQYELFRQSKNIVVVSLDPRSGISFSPRINIVTVEMICGESLRGKMKPGTQFLGNYQGKGRAQPKLPSAPFWIVTFDDIQRRVNLTSVNEDTNLLRTVIDAALKAK